MPVVVTLKPLYSVGAATEGIGVRNILSDEFCQPTLLLARGLAVTGVPFIATAPAASELLARDGRTWHELEP